MFILLDFFFVIHQNKLPSDVKNLEMTSNLSNMFCILLKDKFQNTMNIEYRGKGGWVKIPQTPSIRF